MQDKNSLIIWWAVAHRMSECQITIGFIKIYIASQHKNLQAPCMIWLSFLSQLWIFVLDFQHENRVVYLSYHIATDYFTHYKQYIALLLGNSKIKAASKDTAHYILSLGIDSASHWNDDGWDVHRNKISCLMHWEIQCNK